MVSAVSPVSNNYSYYAIGGVVNNSSSANAATNYDEVLALQAQNDLLLSIGDSSSTTSTDSTSEGSLLTADLLNLSPAALNILNGIDTSSTNTATLTGTLGAQTTLTPTQQQAAASIVAQFANAPFTQTTFNQIESELTNAGINPQQVSIQQLLSGYVFAFGSPDLSGQLAADTLADDLVNA